MALTSLALWVGGVGEAQHACRFWGVIGAGHEAQLLRAQLREGPGRTLKSLGASNPDGWGFAVFPSDTLRSVWPLVRRGRPAADQPRSGFAAAVAELQRCRPRAILANIREHAVRHAGIPDPQPFLHDGWALLHSGNVRDVDALEDDLLTATYLAQHPPDHTGPKLDAELLALYLIKMMNESPGDPIEGIHTALVQLAPVTGDDRLDCLFTRGDSLFALRYAGADSSEPLVYRSLGSCWLAATQPLGAAPEEGADGWAEIPSRTLAVFVPGEAPRFHAVGPAISPAPASPAAVPLKVRGWALIGSDYEAADLEQHLLGSQGLQALGHLETHGWGVAGFLEAAAPVLLDVPLAYRGGPPASHLYDPDYDLAVSEVIALRPRAAVGHVRAASSGHSGVPDPHPFLHDGWAFVHNGTLASTPVLDYLENVEPRDYLEQHPPQYTDGQIDSELLMLYLQKFVAVHAELSRAEALRRAILELSPQIGSSRLNFLMSEGDTLYTLRYNDAQGVVFGPVSLAESSPWWVVASEAVGAGMSWHTIPTRTLVVFVPGQVPAVYPIHSDVPPVFSFKAISVQKRIDADGDGWSPLIRVDCDPDVEYGSALVSVRLLARAEGDFWRLVATTPLLSITGDAPDTSFHPEFAVSPDTLAPGRWELMLQLMTKSEPGSPVATATGESHPGSGLARVGVEGALRDAHDDRPPALRITSAELSDPVDLDGDGHARAFRVRWETSLERADSAGAYVRIYYSDGVQMPQSQRSADGRLRAGEPQAWEHEVTVTPATRLPAVWELYLELRESVTDTLAHRVTADDFAALEAIAVEGARQDDPGAPARAWIGPAVNPAPGSVRVRVGVPEGGADLRLTVLDVQGRCVRRRGPESLAPGEQWIEWDGRDGGGRAAAAGLYVLDLALGEERMRLRAVLVR